MAINKKKFTEFVDKMIVREYNMNFEYLKDPENNEPVLDVECTIGRGYFKKLIEEAYKQGSKDNK